MTATKIISDNGVSSGVTGVQTVGGDDGTLQLQTTTSGGTTTTAMTIDGSQNVGIASNLSLTGAGARITGDFSNATVANRAMFQSSTTNGATGVIAIPNGTGVSSNFEANSDSSGGTNASVAQMAVSSLEARFSSAIRGTGSYVPMTFYTGGSERMRVDTSGYVTMPGNTASAIYPRFSVGVGTGSAGLTVNDGYGNCNVTFNHTAGVPDSSGSSARIVCSVDSTSAVMQFMLANNVTSGVAATVIEAASIDSSYNFKFNSGYGSAATAYGCRAWVNFNGTGTVAIRASGNVSSITDNAAGDYTVNLTTAMPDANYSAKVTSNNGSPSAASNFVYMALGYTATSSTYRFNTGSNGSVYVDCASINVAIFR